VLGSTPLVQQIGYATDRENIRVLAQAVQALPAKLTEAQVQDNVVPRLRDIGNTTDFGGLQARAEGLRTAAFMAAAAAPASYDEHGEVGGFRKQGPCCLTVTPRVTLGAQYPHCHIPGVIPGIVN
jgi:hypothetical protein